MNRLNLQVLKKLIFTGLVILIVPLNVQADIPPKEEIIRVMRSVNDHWMETDTSSDDNLWARATYYLGNMALFDVTQDPKYYDHALAWADDTHNWELNISVNNPYNADNQCAGQAYIELYQYDPEDKKIAQIKANIDNMIAQMVEDGKADYWSWVDALFMSMPVFAKLGALYDDTDYFDKMWDLYFHTKYVEKGKVGNYMVFYGDDIGETTSILDPKFRKTYISNGMKYYTDRDHMLTSVPSRYDGMNAILTPNDDRNLNTASDYLVFEMPADGTVYVGYDIRALSLPNWLSDFSDTGNRIETSWVTQPYLEVFKRLYSGGDIINLGANKAPGFSDGKGLYSDNDSNMHPDPPGHSLNDYLWWRDGSYDPQVTSPNGFNIYWSRGNGWVIAALARVLQHLPDSDSHYEEYVETFQAMAESLALRQRNDGFWNANLDDPDHCGGKETSGTALFTYAMAWGINNNLLDPGIYLPVVEKAWEGMVKHAVHKDGSLDFIQGRTANPCDWHPFGGDDPEDFGVGAFLLAGSEVYKMALYSAADWSALYNLGTSNCGIVMTEFDMTPLVENCNGVIGYMDTDVSPAAWGDLPVIVRVFPHEGDPSVGPRFEARNGDVYDADVDVPYSINSTFHVTITANLYEKTYDVWIQPEGGSNTQIADDYAFRTGAPVPDDLGQVVLRSEAGDYHFKVENHSVYACILASKFEETTIGNGMKYYTDRNYTLTSVPSRYDGMNAILTPNEDRNQDGAINYLTFEMPYGGTVYVAFDSRATGLPDWMDGFVDTGESLETSLSSQPSLNIYSQTYNAGDCINFGANKAPGFEGGRASNYIVFYGCIFVPGPDACTDPGCPCGEGQGDCDSDAECAPGLVCATDVGANYGWPSGRDVCEMP